MDKEGTVLTNKSLKVNINIGVTRNKAHGSKCSKKQSVG
jgi:hypothetical protein